MAGLGGGGAGGASGAIRAGRAYVEFFLKDNQLTKGLAGLEKRMQSIGGMFVKAGAMMAAPGLALVPVVQQFVAFDNAMLSIQAVTGRTADEMKRISDRARELGRTTAFSAVEVGNMMLELARVGFDTPEALDKVTTAILNLSRASGTDLLTSFEAAKSVVLGFQLDVSRTAEVANKLAVTANKSALSVTDLRESFKYVTDSAQLAAVPLDDILAILGMLSQTGIKGEMGGTSLRRVALIVATEGEKLKQTFGVMNRDAAGGFRPLVDVLRDIFTSLKDETPVRQVEKLNSVFQILGVGAVSKIGQAGAALDDLREQIKNSEGEADRMVKVMDSGLGGSLLRLKNSLIDTAISLGESLAPVLKLVSGLFQDALHAVRGFAEGNPILAGSIAVMIPTIVAAGIALVGLGMAFTGFSAAVSIVGGTLTILSGLFGILTSGPVLAAAAVAGLTAALVSQTEAGGVWSTEMGEAATTFGNTVKEAFEGIVAAIGKGDLKAAFEVAAAGLNLVWATMIDKLTRLWVGFKDLVVGGVADITTEMAAMLAGPLEGAGILPRGTTAAVLEDAKAASKVFHAKGLAEIGAAEAELKAATARFDAGVKAAKVAVAPMPREVPPDNLAPMPRLKALAGLAKITPSSLGGSVSGGFGGGAGFFGARSWEKKQLDALENIADGKGKLPVAIGDEVAKHLRFT